MKVAIGSQKTGFPLKEAVRKGLLDAGHEVLDLGQKTPDEQVDFVQVVKDVAAAIKSGKAERGIVICGSGAGVALVANKIRGIFCVACESVFMAERIHAINKCNVMAMGAYTVSHQNGAEMAVRFVESKLGDVSGPDALPALEAVYQKIKAVEDENFK